MSVFGSVTKYLFGSGSDHEHEYTDHETLEQQHGTAEHLETQQEEEDWVVVGAVGDSPVGREQVALEARDVRDTSEPPRLDEQVPRGNERVEERANAVQPQNIYAHPAIAMAQELEVRNRAGQRVERQNTHKEISARRCERQNKVREYQGYPKGGNRRNKRTRPSGCKSSRCTQRM